MLQEILKKLKEKQPNTKEAVLNYVAANLAKGLTKIEDLKDEDFNDAVKAMEDMAKAFEPVKKPEEKKPEEKKPEEKKPDAEPKKELSDLEKALARIEALEKEAKSKNAKETTGTYVEKLATDLKVGKDIVEALLKSDVDADNYDTVKASLESSVKLFSESFGGEGYVPAKGDTPDAATDEADAIADIERLG